jgi:hypothetical protein
MQGEEAGGGQERQGNEKHAGIAAAPRSRSGRVCE